MKGLVIMRMRTILSLTKSGTWADTNILRMSYITKCLLEKVTSNNLIMHMCFALLYKEYDSPGSRPILGNKQGSC